MKLDIESNCQLEEAENNIILAVLDEKVYKIDKSKLKIILEKLIEAKSYCSNIPVSLDFNNLEELHKIFIDFKLLDDDFLNSIQI